MKKHLISFATALMCLTLLLAAPTAAAALDGPNWRVLPIRWQQQYEAAMIGGEGEQHPHAMTRSLSNPDVLYLAHDVGQIWRSSDDGRSWQRARCAGMVVRQSQSVAVDPVDSAKVIATMSNAWDWMLKKYAGVYLSDDGGESWKQVLAAPVPHVRINQRTIVFDPASVADGGAHRWYAAIYGDRLYASEDGGANWSPRGSLARYGLVYQIQAHPSDGKTLYLASEMGLFISDDRGETFKPLAGLPDGEVSSVFVCAEGRTIFTVVKGRGLYLSEDSGRSFYLIKDFPAMYLFAEAAYPDNLFLTGVVSMAEYSHDAGRTWKQIRVTAPLGHPAPMWKGFLGGDFTGICPRPDDPARSVAYARATLWRCDDGDGRFVDSSTLFTGFAWGWAGTGVVFDRYDPGHFWLFCNDIGMVETSNAGRWFTRHGVPRQWFNTGKISWTGMYTGSQQPIRDAGVLVASVGRYARTKLVRSDSSGHAWKLIDDEVENNLFIAFHPNKPQIVYAGNRISRDGGKSFEKVEALVKVEGSIMDMCLSRPDTVYALSKDRKIILRSDDTGLTWRVYGETDWAMSRHDSRPTFTADPANPDRVYTIDAAGDAAAFDGSAWKSYDVLKLANSPAGAANFVNRIVVDPNHPEIIYAQTYLPGCPFVFRSIDGGESWTDITADLPLLGGEGLMVSPHTGEVFLGSVCGTRLLPPPYASPKAIYYSLPDNWLDPDKRDAYFNKGQ